MPIISLLLSLLRSVRDVNYMPKQFTLYSVNLLADRGPVSARLSRGAAPSRLHGRGGKLRQHQDLVDDLEADPLEALRAAGPHTSCGRGFSDAICRQSPGVGGSVVFPDVVVRAGKLLDSAHRLA